METKKKSSNNLLYIVGGVLVLLLAGSGLAKYKGWIGGSKPLEVKLGQAQYTKIVQLVSASGRIQPEEEVKIAPDVPGQITELLIEEGDSVLQGQLLLKIRPDNYQAALEQASAGVGVQRANMSQSKARLAQAKSQFLQRKQEFERSKSLYEQKVIPLQEYQAAQTALNVSEADLEAATQGVEAARNTVVSSQASLSQAQDNLLLTSVFAPRTGIVSKLSVKKGERVVGTSQMAGTEMLRIADFKSIEVRVNINENDVVKINKGDSANIEVDAYPEQVFKGVVMAIAKSAKETAMASTDAVTEFEVRIRVNANSYKHLEQAGKPSPFLPGMTASVEIITDVKDKILTVPLNAVTTRLPKSEDGKNTNSTQSEAKPEEVIFVYDKTKGTVRKVKVKTGISDFNNIEITEGIKENESIVVGPYNVVSKQLKEGSKVTEATESKEDEEDTDSEDK
ncbi:MAG: HlyD family efflux transporter periplasmic adaptor subunit [Cytophagales bacterium]|nr:MAG: HlyD family efflux transporter periplasmic adaptor subunit [Cytophagales bacterium]TAF60694.1 MAG: HlyD family efflux transporter periplasmic adaptor subunit [Cytophagales bacterium]